MNQKPANMDFERFRSARPVEMGTVRTVTESGTIAVEGDSGELYLPKPQHTPADLMSGDRVAISRWPLPPPGTPVIWKDIDEEEFKARIDHLTKDDARLLKKREYNRIYRQRYRLRKQEERQQARNSDPATPSPEIPPSPRADAIYVDYGLVAEIKDYGIVTVDGESGETYYVATANIFNGVPLPTDGAFVYKVEDQNFYIIRLDKPVAATLTLDQRTRRTRDHHQEEHEPIQMTPIVEAVLPVGPTITDALDPDQLAAESLDRDAADVEEEIQMAHELNVQEHLPPTADIELVGVESPSAPYHSIRLPKPNLAKTNEIARLSREIGMLQSEIVAKQGKIIDLMSQELNRFVTWSETTVEETELISR